MNKLIWIFMLALIGLYIICAKLHSQHLAIDEICLSVEIQKDHDGGDKKGKDYQFIAARQLAARSALKPVKNFTDSLLLQSPVIDANTPPPDILL